MRCPENSDSLSPEAVQEAAEFLAQLGARRKPGEVALAHPLGRWRSRQPADAHRHRQRRHAVPGRFGRQRHRRPPIDHLQPDPPGGVRRAQQRGRADLDRAALLRQEQARIHDVHRARPRRCPEPRTSLPPNCARSSSDVRMAVRDWHKLQGKMREDAAADCRTRGQCLARLVCRRCDDPPRLPCRTPGRRRRAGALGIFSRPGDPTDDGGCGNAMRYFEEGGEVPLLAKAERRSTVHRRVPLDLVVVPIRDQWQGHRNRRSRRPVDQRGAQASA